MSYICSNKIKNTTLDEFYEMFNLIVEVIIIKAEEQKKIHDTKTIKTGH